MTPCDWCPFLRDCLVCEWRGGKSPEKPRDSGDER